MLSDAACWPHGPSFVRCLCATPFQCPLMLCCTSVRRFHLPAQSHSPAMLSWATQDRWVEENIPAWKLPPVCSPVLCTASQQVMCAATMSLVCVCVSLQSALDDNQCASGSTVLGECVWAGLSVCVCVCVCVCASGGASVGACLSAHGVTA